MDAGRLVDVHHQGVVASLTDVHRIRCRIQFAQVGHAVDHRSIDGDDQLVAASGEPLDCSGNYRRELIRRGAQPQGSGGLPTGSRSPRIRSFHRYAVPGDDHEQSGDDPGETQSG